MKHTNTALLTIILLSGVTLLAQDGRRPESRGDQKPMSMVAHDQVAVSDVLGAKVRLSPSSAERDEAAAEQRTAKRPDGKVSDLIIGSSSGKATWAIVSVGGLLGIGDKEVAVPASTLKASRNEDGKPVYDLNASEAELKSLPAFDSDVMKKSGLQVALRNAEASWRKVRPEDGRRQPGDASAPRPETGVVDGATSAAQSTAGEAILASQLGGIAVRCSDTKDGKSFGSVEQCYMDLHSGTVTFLVVGSGGVIGIGETDYLVPFRATRVTTIGDDRKPVLAIAKSSSEMEAAPKYGKPEKGVIGDDNARASCKFYGVEHGAGHDGRKDGGSGSEKGGRSGR